MASTKNHNSFSIVMDLPNEGNSVRCLKDYTLQGQAPTVTTDPATNITSTGATLNGTVNANGSPTTVEFEYYAFYGSNKPGSIALVVLRGVLATQSPVTGTSPTNVSVDVTFSGHGFKTTSKCSYRVIAINSGGRSYGDYDVIYSTYSP